ncbi:MAG: tripartite tricarboxylate transporter substrate binding protein [Clostridia bacterium]|nr:tripartite tricarboxylate transporter substrate binding protein [Clostridia bacterium]
MKNVKKLLAVLLALSMIFALAACGTKEEAKPAEEPAEEAAEEEAEEPAEEPAEEATEEAAEEPAEEATEEAPAIDYPTSVITMIVNYSAGGGTDLSARALADAAATALGGTITVSNVTGGNGTVGVTELANSKADGYTVGVATLAPLALMPYQLDVTYTPDSFKYICAFGQYGYGIVVSKDSPYQTLDDLIAAAKEGTVKFGSTGYPQPITMADFGEACGGSFENVNYPSTTDLVTDVLGGFIPVAMADMASFASYVESGDMILLASATEKHWDVAPEVPTLKELGYDAVCDSYMGICVPADTDDAIVEVLRDAFKKACEDPKFQEILASVNQQQAYMTGEEYEAMVREYYAMYAEVFK